MASGSGTQQLIRLQALPGNSVIYSEQAWAAARKSQDGRDAWFVDTGASRRMDSQTSGEMLAWAQDWVLLVEPLKLAAEEDENTPADMGSMKPLSDMINKWMSISGGFALPPKVNVWEASDGA